MTITDYLFNIAELIGIVAFAFSGTIVAIDRGLDLFGVLVCAICTALGGGTIRDILISSLPPRAFFDYKLLLLAVVSSLCVFIFFCIVGKKRLKWENAVDNLFNIFDAVGLAAFSVTGVQVGIAAGFGDNAFLCVFLGMTTAVGGGMLRDVLCARVPMVLKEQIYATASITGCILYYCLLLTKLDGSYSVYIAMLFIIALRLVSVHFNLRLPHVGK